MSDYTILKVEFRNMIAKGIYMGERSTGANLKNTKQQPKLCNLFAVRLQLLWHVDDAAQAFSFSHQLKCLVYIFKHEIVRYVVVDLNFLQQSCGINIIKSDANVKECIMVSPS